MDLYHFHLQDYNQQIIQVHTMLAKIWIKIVRSIIDLIFFLLFLDGVNKFRVSKQTGKRLPNPRIISNRLTFALGRALGEETIMPLKNRTSS